MAIFNSYVSLAEGITIGYNLRYNHGEIKPHKLGVWRLTKD